MEDQPQDSRKPGRKRLLLAVLLAAAMGAGFTHWRSPPISTTTVPPTPLASKVPEPVNVLGRYLFNGTIFWGRHIEQWATRADGTIDYARPFAGLGTFGRDQYDGWSGDLECPVSATVIPLRRQQTELVFNCRPEFLPEAAKYFNLINLANNHSDNLGAGGLEETRANLIKHGMQPFGHYEPGRTEDICEVVALPVRVQKSDNTQEKGSLPVAFCAWHYFYRLPQPGELEAVQKYAEVMPVFAFLHMGAEYKPAADGLQRHVARRLVDLGAQFVVANNPHWVQDAEAYNGTVIVYSTGNFIFDQQHDAEVTRSAGLDLSLTLKPDDNLKRWLALGPKCQAYKDDCLATAQAEGLSRVTPELTFGIVAGDSSNRLTKKAGPEVQSAVESRLKWILIPSQLSAPSQ